MKKLFFISGCVCAVLFSGCASKNDKLPTSVIDLAGNQKVIGWDDGEPEKVKVKVVTKEKIVYKPVVKYKTKIKTVVKYKTEKDSDGDWVPDSMDKCPNTPPNLTVDHNGCPIITTLRLNFDFNKWYVKKIYYPELKKVADILKNNPNLKIEVAGYTDDIGSASYNLKLSQKRAEAVKNILVKVYGIDPKRIVAKGYGEKYPLAPNTSDTNRALNRRVEIVNITNKITSDNVKIQDDSKRISSIKSKKQKPEKKKKSKSGKSVLGKVLKTISQVH
jgi:OOP family OmpA-OmpF porin